MGVKLLKLLKTKSLKLELKKKSLKLELCIAKLSELIEMLEEDSEDGMNEAVVEEALKLAVEIERISAQAAQEASILRKIH